jgi:hypothetical protein
MHIPNSRNGGQCNGDAARINIANPEAEEFRNLILPPRAKIQNGRRVQPVLRLPCFREMTARVSPFYPEIFRSIGKRRERPSPLSLIFAHIADLPVAGEIFCDLLT